MIEPKFTKPEIHEKKWGRELWIHNSSKYCGKILEFDEGKNFSMHYHLIKEETWFVLDGKILMEYYDLEKAIRKKEVLEKGCVVHILPGILHKLTALESSRIVEVSTEHFEDDSYRVEPSFES